MMTTIQALIPGRIERWQEQSHQNQLIKDINNPQNHIWNAQDSQSLSERTVKKCDANFFAEITDTRNALYLTIVLTTAVALLGVLCGALCVPAALPLIAIALGVIATLSIGTLILHLRSQISPHIYEVKNLNIQLKINELKAKVDKSIDKIKDLNIKIKVNNVKELVNKHNPSNCTMPLIKPSLQEELKRMLWDISRDTVIEIGGKKLNREVLLDLISKREIMR